jgi:HEAT repeat protein
MNRTWILLSMVLGMGLSVRANAASEAQEARLRTLAAAPGEVGIPVLAEALRDEQPLVRRTAARELASRGEAARAALRPALTDTDPLVRRNALPGFGSRTGPIDLEAMKLGLGDEDLTVRETAVRLLVAAPRTAEITALLRSAEKDPSITVQQLVNDAIRAFQPKSPDRILLRERPDMADHLPRIHSVWSMPLPLTGWLFRKDPGQIGHEKKWFSPAADPNGWTAIEIGKPWDPDYVGVAW